MRKTAGELLIELNMALRGACESVSGRGDPITLRVKALYLLSEKPRTPIELMDRLFTDSLVSREKQDFIKEALRECTTGKDRIAAPLTGKEGVGIAHKTGSGYSENGVLAAHNDVAYISLPDGTHYTLAVFVKDFRGTEQQASEVIARISAAVYSILEQVQD